MTEISRHKNEDNPQPLNRFDLLALLSILLPAFFITALIKRYAVNVPYWDIWDWSVRRIALDLGYNLKDLWALTNEHRMFFPQVIDLLIANASSLDMLPRIYAKVPIALAVAIVLYFMYRAKGASSRAYWFAIPVGLLSFSLSYWPSWISPNPLASHLSMLTFILALAAITGLPMGWRALALAAAATFVSALSYASGNAAWLVIFGVMYLRGYRKPRYLIVWTLVALVVLVPYALDLIQSRTILRTVPPAGLLDQGRFILTFLGAPLSARDAMIQIPSISLGGIGLISLFVLSYGIIVHIKDGFTKMLPWLGVSVWVFINAGAAALGRASAFGTQGAAAYRYAHIQSLFWIGILALIAILVTEPRASVQDRMKIPLRSWLNLFSMLLTLLISIGYVNANLYKIQNGRLGEQSYVFAAGRDCLLHFEFADDGCLRQLYPDPDRIRDLMPRLIEWGATFIDTP
jgi:hypothetical protein